MLDHEIFDELARVRENYENAVKQIQQRYDGFGTRWDYNCPFLLPVEGVLQIVIRDAFYAVALCYSANDGTFLEYFAGFYER